jgi:hypothetical protein
MSTIKQFLNAAWTSIANIRSLATFVGLYALLLASIYIFASTREATVSQVLVTFVLLIVIPAEFFILQASILAQALNPKWRAIFINAAKLLIVTIPIIIIGWLIWISLAKLQLRYPAPRPPIVLPAAAAKPQPLYWPSVLFATMRGLIFGIILPLATIHLWIEVAARDAKELFRGGAGAISKRLASTIARGFATSSVFIYAIGLILFALVPYLALFVRISPKGTKTDFALFIFRLLVAFAFTLFGWVATLTALAKNASRAPEARQSLGPGVSPGTPALQNP